MRFSLSTNFFTASGLFTLSHIKESAASSKFSFDGSQDITRSLRYTDTVTCQFASDDFFVQVWVDGEDKSSSVVPQNDWNRWDVIKTLTFADTASVLAIKANDFNGGCQNGGFSFDCVSGNPKWNMSNDRDRLSWLVSSGIGSFPAPPADVNGLEWYELGYSVNANDFGVPLSGGGGQILGKSEHMCGTVWEHGYFNFLYAFVQPSSSPSSGPSLEPSMQPSLIPTVSPPVAGGGGDPHFHAFGDIFFSWQGYCDLILLRSPKLSSTELELSVHIRTRRVRTWSAIDTVAVLMGKDIAEIGSSNGKLFINGEETNMIKSESFSVTRSTPPTQKNIVLYNFDFGNDRKLEVEVNTRTEMLYATLVGNYPQGTTGLLGSPHRPGMFARDGTNMTVKAVHSFAESWQVRDGDPKLFRKMEAPQYPSKCCYSKRCDRLSKKEFLVHGRRLKEVQQISLQHATTVCAVHPPGPMRDFCVEDIIATGDTESATDSFYG